MSNVYAYRMITDMVILGVNPIEGKLFGRSTVTIKPVELRTVEETGETIAFKLEVPVQRIFVDHILTSAILGPMEVYQSFAEAQEVFDAEAAHVHAEEDSIPHGENGPPAMADFFAQLRDIDPREQAAE